MEILYYNSLDSTQKFLIDAIKKRDLSAPIAVVTNEQTDGIGSRGNSWNSFKENLYFSFAFPIKDLPKDMEIVSASIYFSYIFKELLNETDSKIWLKWPNDFYLGDRKAGGTITQVVDENLICGIGLNIKEANNEFAVLDIDFDKKIFLNIFFNELKKAPSWKKIFRKYSLEFELSKGYHTHYQENKISLKKAILNSDGSLTLGDKRIYSLR